MRVILPICLLLVSGAVLADEIGDLMQGMDATQQRINQRASQTKLAFMSLRTMFPDPKLRALAEAAGEGDVAEIDALVAEGVDVNGRGTGNATPLFWAMRDIRGYRRLLELGADPNVRYDDGGTIIGWAMSKDDSNFLRLALKYGGNPNMELSLGRPALFIAVMPGTLKLEFVDLLVDAGANMNVQDKNGYTPMMVAADVRQFDIVYRMLERGADYRIQSNRGKTLRDIVEEWRPRMDPKSDGFQWMNKVTAWLDSHE